MAETIDTIILWPTGAPGAQGRDPEDIPRLNSYIIDASEPFGAIIICPGGGYGGRAYHEGEPVARWLNSLGLSAFVLHYRVAPYRHPYPLLDAQRAIRLVRFNAKSWNIDPGKIGILGFSAGGHLAATVGTHYDHGNRESQDPIERESSRPDMMILCYPVITFGEHCHHGSMINLLGENPSPELRQLLSNETQVTSDTPPAFIWHTSDDAAVPVENSLLFADALSRCNVPFALHIFPSGPHGLGLAENYPDVAMWTNLCHQWLLRFGFCPAIEASL